MQFQADLPHSFREFRPKLIGIRFLLEAQHDIVSLRTCTGSLTARDSGAPRDIGALDGAFRMLLERRRPGGMFFRG